MAGLSSEAVGKVAEESAATPVASTTDSTVSSTLRRSSRARTGRSSLNVEEMVQTVGVPEPNVQRRKRAPVSGKKPAEDHGILNEAGASSKSSAAVEEDKTEESAAGPEHADEVAPKASKRPTAGAKRKNGPVKAPTPRKRRRATFIEVPDNALV